RDGGDDLARLADREDPALLRRIRRRRPAGARPARPAHHGPRGDAAPPRGRPGLRGPVPRRRRGRYGILPRRRDQRGRMPWGAGPTLIECVTYRLGVHTTADDPTKYRAEEEVRAWEQKDPLTRFRAYLEKKDLLEDGLEQRVDEEIAEAVRRFEATPPPDPLTVFDPVTAEMPPHPRGPRDQLARWLR